MGKKLLIFGASITILLAIAYETFLRDMIFITFGVGREHSEIESFPYSCRRIYSPYLESCEDMVIDHDGRRLYAACSTVASRSAWAPGGNSFNASGRTLKDHISVLNIDTPGPDGLYGLQQLSITGDYHSATGDKVIDLHGFDIEDLSDNRVRFWMINHQPPIDQAGHFLDASKVGANSTIEVFEHTRGSKELEFVKTIWSDNVYTPNNLVATDDGGVLVTNDHTSKKPGPLRVLEMISGGGSVAYCSLSTGSCHIASPPRAKFNFANGITLRSDPIKGTKTAYVANSAKGTVSILSLTTNQTLVPIEKVALGMPLDNLSIDSDGDVFAAGFPDVLALVGSLEHPEVETQIPSAVFRISKRTEVLANGKENSGFEVTKVLEDIEGRILPGSTTVVHDVKTNSFWLGGIGSGFIAVCEDATRGEV